MLVELWCGERLLLRFMKSFGLRGRVDCCGEVLLNDLMVEFSYLFLTIIGTEACECAV